MPRTIAALLPAVALVTACGESGGPETASDGPVEVVAGFYPLQFVAERVGGDLVEVTNLTPRGAEPHDLELSARDTIRLDDAGLVVYLRGFSPALDETIDAVADDHAFDVAPAARLHGADEDDRDDGHDDGHDEHPDEHGDDEHDHDQGDHDGHDHADGRDPHFWLDPTRLADVADAVAERLGHLRQDTADRFRTNAEELRRQLEQLDGEFAATLAQCANDHLVTSHRAFGYLAARYGLTQVGIAGLSPDEEPSPAALADVADFVTDYGVTTIYHETLVDPGIAETVAAETGVSTAVLDPLEGLTDTSAGTDYFEVMRANLATLAAGQGCR